MFKLSLAGSALIAMAQAIALKDSTSMEMIKPTGLAQTSAEAGCDSGCSGGCALVMTGCCCEEEKHEPEPPLPPPIDPETPLGNIELNLDVLLTHILHEVHPDPDDIDWPEPNTPEETTMITEVIEPVVIQLINDDVAPAIPTCTLPGQQGSASLADEGNSDSIDNAAVISTLIEETLAEFDFTEGVTFDEIMDESMPAADIIEQMDIESPEGEAMVETIVENARTIAEHNEATAESVSDDIQDGLEEAGLDTNENEEAIDTIVDNLGN